MLIKMAQDPQFRRLIKFGNSSYIVSLPKEWIDKTKLKKGDLVYIAENSNSELILSTKKRLQSDKTLSIDIEGKNYNEIKRIFSSAYIHNYSEITLRGKNTRPISEIAHKLMQEKTGLEIIEESNSQILIKDIFDFDTVSLEKIIRRFDNIIRSILEDLREGLKAEKFKEWTFKEIYKADIEVNKAYFLIIKIIRKCQEDVSLMNLLKINSKDLLDVPSFATEAEHMGDEIKRIAKILTLVQSDSTERKAFSKLLQTLEKDYIDTMTAYYTGNKNIAQEIWNKKEKYIHQCEAFSEKSQNPRIWSIIEKFKGIVSNINNISKIISF